MKNPYRSARLIKRHAHGDGWLAAMADGLKKHGLKIRWSDTASAKGAARDDDLLVVWSHHEQDAIAAQVAAGGDYLVAECAYLGDRLTQCSLGFNGLHGTAQVPPPGDAARGQQWHHLLRPYHRGQYTLIMGQVPGDAAIADVDFPRWVQLVASDAHRFGLPVYYRPHPKGSAPCRLPVRGGSLETDLAGAHRVITWSSNGAVDAVLAGCLVHGHSPRSMVYDQPLNQRNDLARLHWLNALAWRQWSHDELTSGDAFAHLLQPLIDKPSIDKPCIDNQEPPCAPDN